MQMFIICTINRYPEPTHPFFYAFSLVKLIINTYFTFRVSHTLGETGKVAGLQALVRVGE